MKNYFKLKYSILSLERYIFFFIAIYIFLTVSPTKGMTEENVFTINNVRVEGAIDLNFSRNKYLNKAFLKSYEMLMSRILITRDLQKVNKTELKGVKNLINSFQILEESYSKNMYSANIKVFYNEKKLRNF